METLSISDFINDIYTVNELVIKFCMFTCNTDPSASILYYVLFTGKTLCLFCHANSHCKVTQSGVTLADYKNKFIIFQVPFVQIFDIRNPSFVSGKFPCVT